MRLYCAADCFRKHNRTSRAVDITNSERVVLWTAIARYQHWQSDGCPALLEVQYKQHYCRQWHDQPHAANRGTMNWNENSGWGFRFCGMWCCVVCWVVSDILKDPFTFIFRSNQSKKNIFFMDWLPFKMVGTNYLKKILLYQTTQHYGPENCDSVFISWLPCVQVFSMVVKLLNSSTMQQQGLSISDDFLLMQKMLCWQHPLDWTAFPSIRLSLAHSSHLYFDLDLPPEVRSHTYNWHICSHNYN